MDFNGLTILLRIYRRMCLSVIETPNDRALRESIVEFTNWFQETTGRILEDATALLEPGVIYDFGNSWIDWMPNRDPDRSVSLRVGDYDYNSHYAMPTELQEVPF